MPPSRSVIIRPEYSAIAAKNRNPSRAVKVAISLLKDQNAGHICEIGCGLLANTPHFMRAFRHVILTDTKAQYDRISERLSALGKEYGSYQGFIDAESFGKRRLGLDAAIIINVIHTLPSVEDRIRLLAGVARNLRQRGLAFIDVPHNETYYRNFVKTATPYRDGYIMRRDGFHTFYKDLDFDEIRQYVEQVGLRIVRRVYLDHRSSLLAGKK